MANWTRNRLFRGAAAWRDPERYLSGAAGLVAILAFMLAAPAGSRAAGAATYHGYQVVPAYQYKVTFSGQGELNSSDSNGIGWDNTQSAIWSIVPNQPVQLWVAEFNPPAGASYSTTATSTDADPNAGTITENGHWPDTGGERAYSCQGPVGILVQALFKVDLGSAPAIRTDFAGSGMAAGGAASAVGTAAGSCSSMPTYSGIDGLGGFFAYWLPPNFASAGSAADGQVLAVGAQIPQQDLGRYSFTLLAQDYNQVTDPGACRFSVNTGPTCQPKFKLTGEYTFTEVCKGKVAIGPGGTPAGACYSHLNGVVQAAKQKATEAALNANINCGGMNGLLTGHDLGGGVFCAKVNIDNKVDSYEAKQLEEIANDPPDASFTSIARPHPPRVKGLVGVRRGLHASYRLLRLKLKVAALVGAVASSLNRAGGALVAVSRGNSAAASDIAKQQRAAHTYAQQAAHLLGGARRLVVAAAAELRALAATAHGTGAGRVAADVRRDAARLVSRQARQLTQLEIRVLKEIGS